MEKLSVIISAYSNPEMTAIHVRECMNSSRIPDEIIVVNDHGDPCLKDMLKALEKKTDIIYAYITEDIPWNYTGARNLGIWLSTGDYLSVEDNDNIPSKDAYKAAVDFLNTHSDVHRVKYGRRPRVPIEEISKPVEEWHSLGKNRPGHDDTVMMRRSAIMKVKGYDEQFAGHYAWACTDWRRRLLRANLLHLGEDGHIYNDAVTEHFYAIIGGGTDVCECEEKERDKEYDRCNKCGKPIWTKSYRNYRLARLKDGHIQSPIGILNFNYEFEHI